MPLQSNPILLRSTSAALTVLLGGVMGRDLHSHGQAARLFWSMTIVFGIVPIAGPLVGAGLLVAGGWRAVLAFYAVVNAILFVAVITGIRETAPAERGSMHPLRL